LDGLMSARALRDEMGARGVAFAKQFSSGSVLAKWEALLKEVKANGMAPLQGEPVSKPAYAAGPRLPVPSSATKVPRMAKPRLKSTVKSASKRAKSAPRHAWQSPLPSKLGYPRIHPENGYDAL